MTSPRAARWLGIVIASLAVCGLWLLSLRWLPLSASDYALGIDRQFRWNFLLVGGVYLLSQLALAAVLFIKRTDAVAAERKPKSRLELTVFALACALFLGVGLAGTRAPAAAPAAAEPIRVEVTAVQFRWYFRYPGADRAFGRTDAALVDASLGNPLGVDRRDPAASDDFLSSALVVPIGREVEITLRSQDVIHSLFIPALRLKQDAVPGMLIPVRLTATRLGNFDTACAELCGMSHFNMSAKMKVISQDEYAKWAAAAGRAQ